MKIVISETAIVTISGIPIDALPVRIAGDDERSSTGWPVDVMPVEEDATGVPVFIVDGKTHRLSDGSLVETLPISGIVA